MQKHCAFKRGADLRSPAVARHFSLLTSHFALVLTLMCFGCSQMTRPDQARIGQEVGPEEFLHEHLQQQPVVTVAEAYRAMVILAEGEDQFRTFAEREEYLLARGALRQAWNLQADEAIQRGSVAYMVCEILGIRGGVNREILGRLGVGDHRYARRELVYLGLMENGADYRYMTGSELVDVVARADAWMAEHGRYTLDSERVNRMLEEGRPIEPGAEAGPERVE